MHIIVFPGWYPNRTDTLSGDFIQRHMHAIAFYSTVTVIIPVKTGNIKKAERVVVRNGKLTEIYYYYPGVSKFELIDNLISFIRYNIICLNETKLLVEQGEVALVHLYVLQKNHLVGFLLKWLYKIPFVISEQSTLYIDLRFEKLGQIKQLAFKRVFSGAASYHAVSKYLATNLKNKLGLNKEAVVIPNVVDHDLFYLNEKTGSSIVTFVHVSNMVFQKNVEGMLQAFASLKEVQNNFVLNLVGPMPLETSKLINSLGLTENVVIWGMRNYKEVAAIMQKSDAFVFFTRFETFGCVIIEANACGLPVIVSDLDVTRELITNKVNGLFVENEKVEDLTAKLLYFLNHKNEFDNRKIAADTRTKFNYEQIGRQFYNWYLQVLSR